MSLDSFTRLNSIVSVYDPNDGKHSIIRPETSASPSPPKTPPPSTVLLLVWAGAARRHIEKYVALYMSRFPTARIILVTSGVENFIYRSNSKQRQLVSPVVKALCERPDETLLVHVLSNGGSKQWINICIAYLKSTGHILSNDVTVIDSAPGRSTYVQSLVTGIRVLPKPLVLRVPLSIVLALVLAFLFLLTLIPGNPDVIELMRRDMNDAELVSLSGRRCYIYSPEDDTIGWEDVEDHAQDARDKGWDVTMVKFQGSTHVGHFRLDPSKYWNAIESIWNGECQ